MTLTILVGICCLIVGFGIGIRAGRREMSDWIDERDRLRAAHREPFV